jgi:glycosyltransferase involved in cell wall biosynthesis
MKSSSDPLVSVIIPTYGGGDYLERAIQSVLNQTYKNLEVIVVDDNGKGTENQLKTEEVIKRFENRVRYIVHKENRNGSAARNTGASFAKGVFFAFLDDDDEYYHDNIETLTSALLELDDSYAFCYGGCIDYLGDKQVAEFHPQDNPNPIYNTFMHRLPIGTNGFVIRASVYNKVHGFDESFKRHQDWEFLGKVIAQYRIKAIDVLSYKRHILERNKPKEPDVLKPIRLHYLKEMAPFISKLPKQQQKDIYVENRLSITILYLKQKRFKEFIKDYIDTKPGLRGVRFMSNRVWQYIIKYIFN